MGLQIPFLGANSACAVRDYLLEATILLAYKCDSRSAHPVTACFKLLIDAQPAEWLLSFEPRLVSALLHLAADEGPAGQGVSPD